MSERLKGRVERGWIRGSRAPESRFRAMIDHSPQAIHLFAPDGRSLLTNRAWEDLWDIEENERPGDVNIFEDERLRSVGLLDYVEGSIAAGGSTIITPPLMYEPARFGREGRTRWLRGMVYPTANGEGRAPEMVLALEDVTGHHQVEEDLRESEERHRRRARELELLDRVRAALARELEPREVFRIAVEATARTLGFSLVSLYLVEEAESPAEGEHLVLQHQVGYHQVLDHIPVEQGVMGRVARTGEPILISDDQESGMLRAFEGIASEACVPIFDGGRVAGVLNVESTRRFGLGEEDLRLMAVLGEQVGAAMSRARLHAEVRANEARFKSLTQNASDVITILDADGIIRYESLSIERVLGYRPEELVGGTPFDYIHPDDVEGIMDVFTKNVERPGVMIEFMAYRFRHKDGSWRRLESTASNLLHDPAVKGIVVNSRDVTERKRSEERLKEAEARYRTLVETVPAITYTEDFETGATLYDSPQIEDILGYPADTYAEDPAYWSKIVHPEDQERIRAEEERSAESGRFSLEYRVRARDGRQMWLRDEATMIRDSQGRPVRWRGLLFDVTERREVEERLRDAEARYRAIVEEVPTITYIFRQKPGEPSAARYVSPQIEGILGYTPEEYTGNPDLWREILHPADRERVLREDLHTGKTGETFRAEFRMIAKDGSVAWFREEGRLASLEEDGSQSWHGVMYDITELKRVEQALREAEIRYRTLVENIPSAIIYIQDTEGTSTSEYLSPQIEQVLGYTPEECMSEPDHWVKILHPEDRARVLAEDRRTNATGEPFSMEYRQIAKDGRVVWIRDEAVLVRGEDGGPLYWQGIQVDITERRELEERLRHQAMHDDLTGLPNRTLFMDRLDQALARTGRREEPIAVLFLDLDDFKAVNDSLGHEAGDRLLEGIAGRLRECVRPEDTVSRFGGDEFVLLLEGIATEGGAERAAQRIMESLAAPFILAGRELFISASIGIAAASAVPEDGLAELLRNADLALYEAKRSGKAKYEVFGEGMGSGPLERLELESGLRRAVERGELRVFYQPKVSAESGEIVSLESLVRWQHPERGLLEPEHFLQAAEETGLIQPIGEWMLREICRQGRLWQDRERPPRVCLNVSSKQFLHPDLVEKVAGALEASGLEPRNLSLEVAENVLVEDAEAAVERLGQLKDLGVHTVIDDFGAAYSSLSQLGRFPLNLLKIGRSLTARIGEGPQDTAVVAAAIGLAHTLGWSVAAHGVETADQLARLRELDCDFVQGFYFSRPVTGEGASALLDAGPLS